MLLPMNVVPLPIPGHAGGVVDDVLALFGEFNFLA
jgi:hypothetical protein